MPRHPQASSTIAAMVGSVYSSVAARLRRYDGEIYPLHVGDTWMEPAVGCRMEDLTVAEHPGMHRYSPPAGRKDLRRAIARHTEERSGCTTTEDQVIVSAGATAALSTAVGALVDPGEEVLIMAPFWPLIAGMVQAFRGTPVPVPFFAGDDLPSNAEEAVEAFRSRCTERTVALYVNTPHNPSGKLLPAEWARALVEWAAAEGLWVLSDEVYEEFVYTGEHVPLRPMDPQRVITSQSFSKAYGMTGNRCGYLVGPAEALAECKKIGTHTYYCAPTASQLAAVEALAGPGKEWARTARERYAELGRAAAAKLGVAAPEGSTFFFVDVSEQLDPDREDPLLGFLERCADRGLLVAPGPSFGPYPHHVRVCFTSAEPEVVLRGFDVLAELLNA